MGGRDRIARVGLRPRLRVERVRVARDAEDHAVARLVLEESFGQLLDVVAVLRVHRRGLAFVGGGDLDDERLGAGAGARLDGLHEISPLVEVELVDDGAVHVGTVEGVSDVGHDFESRVAAGVDDLVVHRADTATERRGLLSQGLDGVEDERGLLHRRCGREDLGARLAVSRREVDGEAAAHGRLAVLAGHVDVDVADDARVHAAVVLADPAEDGRDDPRDLPGVRGQRFAS